MTVRKNLVGKSSHKKCSDSWSKEVNNEHSANVSFTTSDHIIILGQVKLYKRLGDLCVRTVCNVMETLSVHALTGSYFKH